MQRLGKIKPRLSTEVESSPFGFNYGSNAINAPEAMDTLLDLASKTGFKWMRLGVRWASVEKACGLYDFTESDPLILATLEHGFRPYMTIGGGNPLYTEMPGGRPTNSPEALAAWQDFLRATVRHYGALGVKHWEIWNEPNWGVSWHGYHYGNPPEYAQMVQAAAEAIRGADSEAVILAGSLAFGQAVEFTDAFMAAGAAESFDVLTFHPYNAVPEDTFETMQKLRETVHKHNPKVKLWQGECGLPSSGDTIHGRPGNPWGLKIQAKYLLRRFLTDLLAGIEVDSWYILSDWKASEEQVVSRQASKHWPRGRDAGINTKGVLYYGTWQPKPAYYAAQHIGAMIDGRARLTSDISVSFRVGDEGIFYGLLDPDEDRYPMVPWTASFTDAKGNALVAWWLPWRMQEIVVPARVDLTIRGAPFRQPVLVDLMEGDVYPVIADPTGDGLLVRGVPLADYPFLLAERAAVPLLPA